jgi:putative tricarboxylic transport membrane protein
MSRISGGTLASALLPMTLGLMLGTIGQEAVTGETRFTFGLPGLAEGVSLVPVVVGLYGFAELMLLIEDKVHAASRPESVRMRDLMPTRAEWKRAVPSSVFFADAMAQESSL